MDYQDLAADVVRRACKAGAHEADVFLQISTDFNVQVRKGEIETLTQAGSKGLGLRVFVDKRHGFACTSDFSPEALERIVKLTVDLAAAADQKPENGLPKTTPLGELPDLQLFSADVESTPTDQKIEMARACEAAAFAADTRITNSDGAGFGSGVTRSVLANSEGFVGEYQTSGCSLYCSPLAEEEGKKQVDYEWSFKHAVRDLESPEDIGLKAAARVLRKLNARKAPTQNAPVVFDRRVAARLWSGLLGAVNGDSVYKGMSYLKDKLGQQIAAPSVTLVGDARLVGGPGSAPFDGEGLATGRNVILRNGVLEMFLYDSITARKVGGDATSSACAKRSYGGAPGVGAFNLHLQPGDLTPEEIVSQIPNGFFVTDLMGTGANMVTGDFSIGASGLWIENGQFAYPVQEVTIAGNMLGILKGIERIGNDLILNGGVCSPTFQVAEMTISGE